METGKAEVLGSVWRWRLVVRLGLGQWRWWHVWVRRAWSYQELYSDTNLPGGKGVGVGNGEFCHILRPVKICGPVCSEVFNARTYPHGTRLIPIPAIRRA